MNNQSADNMYSTVQWWVSVNLNLIRCFYEFGVNKLAIIIEK